MEGEQTVVVSSGENVLVQIARPLITFLIAGYVYKRLVSSLTRTILLPSTLIGRNHAMLETQVKASQVNIKRVRIAERIDAGILNLHDANNKGNGWIIYSNANGVCYEHILDYTSRLGALFGKRVLVYNYRGVGHSTGVCEGGDDMVQDCIDVVKFLRKNIASQEEIFLWGHSIGGAVSILAAAELLKKNSEEKITVVSDRSFYDLSLVVKEKIGQGPLAPIISGLIGSTLALTLTLASTIGFQTHPIPSLEPGTNSTLDWARTIIASISLFWVSLRLGANPRFWVLGGFCFQTFLGNGFELGLRGLFNETLLRLVISQGWSLNPGKVVGELDRKVIVTYHKEDEMISIENSMKCIFVENDEYVIELDGPNIPVSNHMYELSRSELKKIQNFLSKES